MKESGRRFLYLCALSYFLYDSVAMLINGERPFTLGQWLLLAMCVVFVGICIYLMISIYRCLQREKEEAEKAADEAEEQNPEVSEEKAVETVEEEKTEDNSNDKYTS